MVGVAVAWMLAMSSASAATGEPKIETMREGNRITVTLRAGDLTVTQIVTRTGVDLRLTHQDDNVQFSGDIAGRIAVARGGRSRAFALRSAQAADQTALVALLADSPALAAFDKLLHGDWARGAESAVLFKSTREVIRVLQGEAAVVMKMATARTPAATSIVGVRQRLSPSQCWDTYARDVIHFTYELQSCLNSASYQWWNPLATAWCSYEYNLKSSLAAVWLLDCYGVPV
jgi:hypothetical protein